MVCVSEPLTASMTVATAVRPSKVRVTCLKQSLAKLNSYGLCVNEPSPIIMSE